MPARQFHIHIDHAVLTLEFDHAPGTEGALYDICDAAGHVLKYGGITGRRTSVRLDGIHGGELILRVLQGDHATVWPIHPAAAA